MIRFFKIVVISIASILIGTMLLGILALIAFGFYNFFRGLVHR
jgi:hypothetical protein